MMTWRFSTGAFLLFLLMARVPAQGKQIRATLLYDGQTTEISTAEPVAHDEALSTWYFGLRSDQRQNLSSLEAPNFTLADIEGKPHSLSDFRGKKILLITWASW